MKEYCLFNKGGRVINIVTTDKSLSELKESLSLIASVAYIREIETVPLNILEQYQYWNERP